LNIRKNGIYQSIPFIMVTANMEEGEIPPAKMNWQMTL
jgi:hypothetical protein